MLYTFEMRMVKNRPPTSRLSDGELVALCLKGDRGAFGRLVKRYQGRIHAMAAAGTGDREAARDVTQNTFLKAFQALATLKDTERFAAWIGKIALRLVMKHQQEKKTRKELHGDQVLASQRASSPSAEEEASARELRFVARRLISELPEELRAIAGLRYMESLTLKEIGRMVDLPLSTVQTRLERAREMLGTSLRRIHKERTDDEQP
jgi:RNA polymerase sigma-70 factor (ECF subfamily)